MHDSSGNTLILPTHVTVYFWLNSVQIVLSSSLKIPNNRSSFKFLSNGQFIPPKQSSDNFQNKLKWKEFPQRIIPHRITTQRQQRRRVGGAVHAEFWHVSDHVRLLSSAEPRRHVACSRVKFASITGRLITCNVQRKVKNSTQTALQLQATGVK